MKPLNLKNVKFTNIDGKIHVEIKKDLPKNLYKYYSLTDYTVKAINESTLYFSQANLLNDMLEGNFDLLWNFNKFNQNKNILETIKKQIVNDLPNHKKVFLKWRSFFSMCETYNNELLWIHYTKETGYCLELNAEKLSNHFKINNQENNCYFFPISYPKVLKQIEFNDFINIYDEIGTQKTQKIIDVNLPIINCFAVKECHWDYEQEWRIMLKDSKFNYVSEATVILDDKSKQYEKDMQIGGNIEIPRNMVERIILAPLFFNNSRFNKFEEVKDGKNLFEIYNFKNDKSGQLCKDFFLSIKKHYPNKTFQIIKMVNEDEIVYRDIKYKIEIIDIGNNFIKIKKNIL